MRCTKGIVAFRSGGAAGPLIYDDFERSDSTNLGSNWVESGDGAITIATGRMSHTVTGTGFAAWATQVGSADHYVEVTDATTTPGTTDLMTLIARSDGNSSFGSHTFYMAGWQTDAWKIWRYISGSGTVIASSAAGRPDDFKLRFEVEGSAQRLYFNDSLVVSASDANIATGQYVGIRMGNNITIQTFESDVI